MRKGEIWLVDFEPSVGNEYQKVRPALIVQADKVISPLETVIPLSSKIENKQEFDVLVLKNLENRLFVDSILKVQQVSSFDKVRFIHFIGIVSDEILLDLDEYLKKHFDLKNL